jgi:hypothetical protein
MLRYGGNSIQNSAGIGQTPIGYFMVFLSLIMAVQRIVITHGEQK